MHSAVRVWNRANGGTPGLGAKWGLFVYTFPFEGN